MGKRYISTAEMAAVCGLPSSDEVVYARLALKKEQARDWKILMEAVAGRPGVYAFAEGGRWLYVGFGSCLATRLPSSASERFMTEHNKTVSVTVFITDTVEAAAVLEPWLIDRLKPEMNTMRPLPRGPVKFCRSLAVRAGRLYWRGYATAGGGFSGVPDLSAEVLATCIGVRDFVGERRQMEADERLAAAAIIARVTPRFSRSGHKIWDDWDDWDGVHRVQVPALDDETPMQPKKFYSV